MDSYSSIILLFLFITFFVFDKHFLSLVTDHQVEHENILCIIIYETKREDNVEGYFIEDIFTRDR